jgi:serine/threonine protein kinase
MPPFLPCHSTSWSALAPHRTPALCNPSSSCVALVILRLPFEARSLNELKNKIILGSFAPLKPGQPYSAGLVAVAHALLNKDPRRRPTCAAILNSSEAAPWLHAIPDGVRCPLPPLDAVPSELPRVLVKSDVAACCDVVHCFQTTVG